ncbi:MAG: helix-turn-helix protein [Prosthecobacter sp.]|nr:helix-turn-helix protein [Prosthecobacter sp.]
MAVSRYSKKLVALVVEVLRDKREGLGISKKKLASDAGVSRTAIILMESNRRLPSLELTIKLAMGLGIPFSSVVTDAEQRMAKKLSRQSEPSERSE